MVELLAERRPEIEDELRSRVEAVADTSGIVDPEYVGGLKVSLRVGLDYALSPLSCSEGHLPPPPAALLTQARVAARNEVEADVILRRCAAGRTVLKLALIDIATRHGLVSAVDWPGLMRAEGVVFERLMEAVAEAHASERRRLKSREMRKTSLIRRLLVGEMVDTGQLDHDFEAFHTAVIADGKGSADAVAILSRALDGVVLSVPNGHGGIWAWIRRRQPPTTSLIAQLPGLQWPATLRLALGDPAHGYGGWRHSHQQAAAAFLVARRRPGTLIRYAEDPLLFSAIGDELLAKTLNDTYDAPLSDTRDRGSSLRRTLAAYFAAGRNGSSAAAALKISRQAVNSRLRTVEDLLGRPLLECAASLETALKLRDLSAHREAIE